MNGQIQYGRVDGSTSTPTRAAMGECHYTTPVRFGRRKTDQVGHLRLTTGCLMFCGTIDLHVPWTEVAGVTHAGVDIVISLHDTRRVLRFCCEGEENAARAAVVASHLTELAHADPLEAV